MVSVCIYIHVCVCVYECMYYIPLRVIFPGVITFLLYYFCYTSKDSSTAFSHQLQNKCIFFLLLQRIESIKNVNK